MLPCPAASAASTTCSLATNAYPPFRPAARFGSSRWHHSNLEKAPRQRGAFSVAYSQGSGGERDEICWLLLRRSLALRPRLVWARGKWGGAAAVAGRVRQGGRTFLKYLFTLSRAPYGQSGHDLVRLTEIPPRRPDALLQFRAK